MHLTLGNLQTGRGEPLEVFLDKNPTQDGKDREVCWTQGWLQIEMKEPI